MAFELATRSPNQPALANGLVPQAGVMLRPDADIVETDTHVVVVADLPGVAPEDVDVRLERRVLTIRAQTKTPQPEGFRRIHVEHDAASYERAFSLSQDIDEEGIEANVSNGVLTLRLPKVQNARTRRIEVKSA